MSVKEKTVKPWTSWQFKRIQNLLVKSLKRILPLVNRLTDSPVDSPSSLTVLMSPEDGEMSPDSRVVSNVLRQQVKPQAGVHCLLHLAQKTKVTRVSWSNHRRHQVLTAARAPPSAQQLRPRPPHAAGTRPARVTAGWAGLMELQVGEERVGGKGAATHLLWREPTWEHNTQPEHKKLKLNKLIFFYYYYYLSDFVSLFHRQHEQKVSLSSLLSCKNTFGSNIVGVYWW